MLRANTVTNLLYFLSEEQMIKMFTGRSDKGCAEEQRGERSLCFQPNPNQQIIDFCLSRSPCTQQISRKIEVIILVVAQNESSLSSA